MIYDLKNEYQIPKFKEYVNKLFKERAVVEVKKKLPNRTLAQNSYLHLLLGYFGSEYNRFKADHLEGYRVNLIDKIGQQKFALLKVKAAGTTKMTDFEYEQLIKYYKALNKKLRKEKGL